MQADLIRLPASWHTYSSPHANHPLWFLPDAPDINHCLKPCSLATLIPVTIMRGQLVHQSGDSLAFPRQSQCSVCSQNFSTAMFRLFFFTLRGENKIGTKIGVCKAIWIRCGRDKIAWKLFQSLYKERAAKSQKANSVQVDRGDKSDSTL